MSGLSLTRSLPALKSLRNSSIAFPRLEDLKRSTSSVEASRISNEPAPTSNIEIPNGFRMSSDFFFELESEQFAPILLITFCNPVSILPKESIGASVLKTPRKVES